MLCLDVESVKHAGFLWMLSCGRSFPSSKPYFALEKCVHSGVLLRFISAQYRRPSPTVLSKLLQTCLDHCGSILILLSPSHTLTDLWRRESIGIDYMSCPTRSRAIESFQQKLFFGNTVRMVSSSWCSLCLMSRFYNNLSRSIVVPNLTRLTCIGINWTVLITNHPFHAAFQDIPNNPRHWHCDSTLSSIATTDRIWYYPSH